MAHRTEEGTEGQPGEPGEESGMSRKDRTVYVKVIFGIDCASDSVIDAARTALAITHSVFHGNFGRADVREVEIVNVVNMTKPQERDR